MNNITKYVRLTNDEPLRWFCCDELVKPSKLKHHIITKHSSKF